ncbi:MAG TPA: nucleotide exchange factor GrpE [Acidobacteriota bacterium]|nr:nucleotide exchange factor GrpE [Acidobacteriota bacterium]
MDDLDIPDGEPKFKVTDRRFWARKEQGERKNGERAPRKSDLPSYVEQLQLQMEAQREKLKERLQQLEDEKSSFRRRLNEENERRLQTEKHRLAEILLEVMDHLDAAINSVEETQDIKSLLEGVKLTRSDLLTRLGKLGVEKMNSSGQLFDPQRHEAVMTKHVEFEQDGLVIEEIRPGYVSGDVVVRPAQVVVGKSDNE